MWLNVTNKANSKYIKQCVHTSLGNYNLIELLLYSCLRELPCQRETESITKQDARCNMVLFTSCWFLFDGLDYGIGSPNGK